MEYTIKDIQQKQLKMLKEVIRICDQNNILYYAAYGTVLGAIRHNGFIPWDGDVDIYIVEDDINRFISTMKEKLCDEYIVDFRDNSKTLRDFPRIGVKGYETGLLHIDVFRLAGIPADKSIQKSILKRTRILHHLANVKQKGLVLFLIQKRKILKVMGTLIITAPLPLSAIIKWFDSFNKIISFSDAKYVGNITDDFDRCIFPKKWLGKGRMVPFEDTYIRVPERYDEYLKQMYGNYMEYPPQKERDRILNRVYKEVVNPVDGLKTLVGR